MYFPIRTYKCALYRSASLDHAPLATHACEMQYPVGWPRVLDSKGATSGSPVKLLRHRTRELLFELRGSSLAVWHSRVSL